MSQWNFNTKSPYGPKNWDKNFPTCKSSGQSPIDIKSDQVRVCNLLCQLKIHYKANSCRIQNNDNLMNILYDNGSFVIYKSENNIKYNLFKIVPHIPGLHKINGIGYDMELHLHHRNKDGQILIIAVLINIDENFSYSQDFFNQFVPNLRNITVTNNTTTSEPGNEFDQEYNYSISVSSNWSVESVLPVLRNFFLYKGTLPYPPCSGNVIWIIFENSVNMNKNDFEILKERLIYTNSRKIYPLNPDPKIIRHVYYNNDIGVGIGSKMKGKIYIKCKKIEKNKNEYTEIRKDDKDKKHNKNRRRWRRNRDRDRNDSEPDNSLADFFNSSAWKTIRSFLAWGIAIYIAIKYIVPNLNYSFEYNKALYLISKSTDPPISIDIRGKTLTYSEAITPEDLHKMVSKYVRSNTNSKFDLSCDTWFNQWVLKCIHWFGYMFWETVLGTQHTGTAPA